MELAKKATDMGLRVRGLCFHVGSQNLNPFKYKEAIAECRRVFNHLLLEGICLDLLDIGGGFPVEYVDSIMPLRNFFTPIRKALDSYFPSTTVIAEPGRFIVGDAANLILTVKWGNPNEITSGGIMSMTDCMDPFPDGFTTMENTCF
ncbi:MAG: hypothetical protein ACOX2B_04820 [Syntrophothermaceae bacterium]